MKIAKIHFLVVPPFGLFCSVKYLNFEQKLLIQTAHHIFLENRHPEVTKNPNYVLSPKGSKKKVSANGLITVCRAVYILYFKINTPSPHFLLSFLFWNLSQLSGQDQQNSKQTYCQLLIFIFLWTPKGFISPARAFLRFPPKPVYSTMVAERFQIYSGKITGNTLVSQKTESVKFYSYPQTKLSCRFLSLSPRQMGIAHSLGNWKNYQN